MVGGSGTGKNRARKMNILFLNQYFYPDLASTGQLLAELSEDLAEKKHGVTVVAGLPSYNPSRRLAKRSIINKEMYKGVQVIRTYSTTFPRKISWKRSLNYLTFVISALVGGLVSGKQDVIAYMTDPPVIGAVGYMISRIKRIPPVYVVQDIFPELGMPSGMVKSRFTARILGLIKSFLLSHSTKIVVIGEKMKKAIIREGFPPNKVTIIHNWVDTDLIRPENKINTFSRKYNLHQKFVVMHSGNIATKQGLYNLLRAARMLKKYPDILFLIIGDGIDRERLLLLKDELSLTNVLFLSYQRKEMLKYSLASADVGLVMLKKGLSGYLVPSKIYGIMASGRPVIASIDEESEVTEMIRDSRCGIAVEPENPEKLAEAIEYMYRHPDILKKWGENGRRYVKERYSRKIASAKYETLLRSVVDGSGSRR